MKADRAPFRDRPEARWTVWRWIAEAVAAASVFIIPVALVLLAVGWGLV